MIKDDLTILVNSCDKYEETWLPFFTLFEKFSGSIKYCDIVLNTERKKFHFNDLKIKCPNNIEESIQWGERLKKTLKSIRTPFVLFMLDDFFLRKEIEEGLIEKVVSYMKQDCNISFFSFISISDDFIESKKYPNFCKVSLKENNSLSAQIAVWRKDDLYKSILNFESPWQWEVYGRIRNQEILEKNGKSFYIAKSGYFPIDYGIKNLFKWGIVCGKWCLSDVKPLFEEHNLCVDFSRIGVLNENLENPYLEQINKSNKKQSIFKRFAENIKLLFIKRKTDYYKYVTKPVLKFKKGMNDWDL